MTVYKAQRVVTNYLDVSTNAPKNPVNGQKWMDGTVMKTWDEIKKEWITDDLKGEDGIPGEKGADGKDTYIHKAWSWSADGADRFTDKYPNENLIIKSSLTLDKYINANGVLVNNTASNVTDYIPVNSGDWIVLSGYTILGNASGMSFFDSDKQYISGVAGGGTNAIRLLQAPQNAKYARYTVYKLDINTFKIEIGKEPTIYTPSPKDDFENAWPKYEGYYSSHSPVQSTNPSDYTWTPIPREPGQNAAEVISGSLSNDSIILSATSTGVVSDYSKAYGDFVVYEGQNKLANGVTYSKVSETGMTSSINASGRYTVTNIATDTAMAIYRATYKGVQIDKQILVVKNKQGSTGPQGPPTGITVSATVPNNPYVNMLWQNTGSNNDYSTGTVYQWNGQKWNTFIFTAENIAATTLSAISAYLGDVIGGSFTGGKFINDFVDIPLLYDNTRKATGRTIIEDGVMTITGKIDGTYDFVTKYTVDAISSTIYYPNSTHVMKAFSLSPDGLLLVDHENGFNGQLLASSLTKTPWVNIQVNNGYSINASKPPQYKVNYNLDGTRTLSFRGQVVRLVNNNIADMEADKRYNFANLPTTIHPNVEANGYGVTNSGNGAKLYATETGVMGCLIGSTNTTYLDISNLTYIVD